MAIVVRAAYPATYRDRHGVERTALEECFSEDEPGSVLRLVVRGATFTGIGIWALASSAQGHRPSFDAFTIAHGFLCAFVLEFVVPVPVDTPRGPAHGRALIGATVGGSIPGGDRGGDRLDVRLLVRGRSYAVPEAISTRADLEEALLAADDVLPPGVSVRVCAACALADRNPAGGPLACFRGNKEAFRRVRTKAERFRIWPTLTEYVQEFWHCPEFERRTWTPAAAGTGV